MYSIDWSKIFLRPAGGNLPSATTLAKADLPGPGTPKAARWLPMVSRTVWALGFTSLLTDISSEMISSILPVYLVLYLGVSPLVFGVMDGLYQGVAALVRVAGGVLADRWRQHKAVAVAGYGLSAACRLLILLAGSAWGMISVIITLDRIGKGIRTAPRDALISQRSAATRLATAFGVHRAMDAVGALLGPVLAFTILALMPHAFNVLFVVSFGVALLGLGVITLFVPGVMPGEKRVATSAGVPRVTALLLGNQKFRVLMFTAVMLGLASISDGFIYLILQKRLAVSLAAFPLLYVGTSLFTSLFAIPCGRLADRVGRTPVLLGGYGLLVLVYLILLLPVAGLYQIAAVLFMLGVFYAATDGVLTAMAAATLPATLSGSGLAVLGTATDLSRLAASVSFGLLWSFVGIRQATVVYLLGLVVAVAGSWLFLTRRSENAG